MIVFSNKAYNAIIRESFDKDPDETGGILLGHVLDNGVWIVMEVLPPGTRCVFERAYFEYDDVFVNYLAQSVANQYWVPLDLLGLWHRHPGSMDVFSATDDGTNLSFARQNRNGVISGLVNIDPQFRLTMYHADCPQEGERGRPRYENVEFEVGDDIIPKQYFKLRYYNGDVSELHPGVDPARARVSRQARTARQDAYPQEERQDDAERVVWPEGWGEAWRMIWELWRQFAVKNVLALALLVIVAYGGVKMVETVSETPIVTKLLGNDTPSLKDSQISLREGGTERLEVEHVTEKRREKLKWRSSNPKVASVDYNGVVTAHRKGTTTVTVYLDKKRIGSCRVTVKKNIWRWDNRSLAVGSTDTLRMEWSDFAWRSENDSVAQVENGIVRGIRPGWTEVRALVEGTDMETVYLVEVVADTVVENKVEGNDTIVQDTTAQDSTQEEGSNIKNRER